MRIYYCGYKQATWLIRLSSISSIYVSLLWKWDQLWKKIEWLEPKQYGDIYNEEWVSLFSQHGVSLYMAERWLYSEFALRLIKNDNDIGRMKFLFDSGTPTLWYIYGVVWCDNLFCCAASNHPDSKFHGANMGPTWVLSVPGGPHVGPMNFFIRAVIGNWNSMVKTFRYIFFVIWLNMSAVMTSAKLGSNWLFYNLIQLWIQYVLNSCMNGNYLKKQDPDNQN